MMEKVCERLKSLRKQKGMTQHAVAEAVHMTDTGYIYYETGRRVPRLEQAIALADFFDVSLDYLVGRSDDPTRHG